MMQDGDDLDELLFLEQAIPNVIPERFRADMTQLETAGEQLMRMAGDPIQSRPDRVEASFRLVRNLIVVIHFNVVDISLSVSQEPDGVAHPARGARRRDFHSSSVR